MSATKSPESETSFEEALQRLEGLCQTVKPQAPLDLLVLAVVSDGEAPSDGYAVYLRLRENFVDWNELRVARRMEVARLMDPMDGADTRAKRLQEMLNRLFDYRGALELSFLEEMKPTEGRKRLLKMDDDMPRDAVSQVLFALCPGTTIPLSPEALALAKKEKILDRNGNKAKLQKQMAAETTPDVACRIVQALEILAASDAPKRTPKKPSRKSGGTKKKTTKKASGASKSAKKKTTKKSTSKKKS